MKQKPKNRTKTEATCKSCGQSFMAVVVEINRGKGTTCSRSCASALAHLTRDSKGLANNNWKGGIPTPYRESKRRYTQRHPEKVASHRIVRRAIMLGELVRQACETCGIDPAQAHHEDYSKPLDVVWLCKKHHEARHVELRA